MKKNNLINRGGTSCFSSSSAVELWAVQLDSEAELSHLLSRDELDRVARMRDEQARRRYVVGRATLRRLLGARLGTAPEKLRFDYGERGKPTLADSGLSFNLSHSGEMGLIAISEHRAVGVDIEQLRPRRRLDLLARRVLTGSERELLERAHHVGLGAWGLLRFWTAKEAVAKALGFGLALAPSRIAVVPDGFNRALAEVAPAASAILPDGAKPLRVDWLSGLDHAVAAVVVDGAR